MSYVEMMVNFIFPFCTRINIDISPQGDKFFSLKWRQMYFEIKEQ